MAARRRYRFNCTRIGPLFPLQIQVRKPTLAFHMETWELPWHDDST